MACAYYYGSTMCNSMLSDTYHNNNNNTKAAVYMFRVDSSLTRVSSCLLSYEPPRYEIEVLREATLLLYDKTRRVLALHGPRLIHEFVLYMRLLCFPDSTVMYKLPICISIVLPKK